MPHRYRESLKVCNECGEIYDANIEAEALHHDKPVHDPLRPGWRVEQERPLHAVACAA